MAKQKEKQQQVRLHFSVRKLAKLDVASKSDPFLVVSIRNADDGGKSRLLKKDTGDVKAPQGIKGGPSTENLAPDATGQPTSSSQVLSPRNTSGGSGDAGTSRWGAHWKELGRTETRDNVSDTSFTQSFTIPYEFEQKTEIRIDVYDRDNEGEDLARQDYIGSCECLLAQAVTSPGHKLTLALSNAYKRKIKSYNPGFAEIIAEPIVNPTNDAKVLLDIGFRLANKKDKAASNVQRFFTVGHSIDKGQTYMETYRSEAVRFLDGVGRWKALDKTLGELCGGQGDDASIRITLYLEKSNGHHVESAHVDTTMKEIGKMAPNTEIGAESASNSATRTKKPGFLGLFGGARSSGRAKIDKMPSAEKHDSAATVPPPAETFLIVNNCIINREPTFLDYVQGGCKLSFALAIDFTASNGDPREPGTLHYVDPAMESPEPQNQYEAAVCAVFDLLHSYLVDERIPAYGFGARLPPTWEASHCFPLTGDPANPFVNGYVGFCESYRQAMNAVQLYGPTIFADIIRAGIVLASEGVSQKIQRYTVLLVITDGVISDINATMLEVIKASRLPLSIIVVGVGSENFAKMEVLDSDEALLKVGDQQAARDIVQFVPFADFHNNPQALAAELLEELPDQVVEFFQMKGIKPNPPLVATTSR